MGEENWTQRQPGSVAGSVVPPPAAEIPPALPKRAARPGSGPQSARPGQRPPVQQLPDSLRSLFKPVLTSPPAAGQVPGQDLAPGGPATPAGSAWPAGGTPRQELQGAEPRSRSRLAARMAAVRTWLGRPAGSRRRRLALLAALASVAAAAGGTAVVLSGNDAGLRPADPGGTRAPGTSGRAISGLSAAGTARVRAAAWISREVSRSAIVACDAVMCSSLISDGLPAFNLLVISPTTPDPLGADVVAATPVVRSQFGGRLSSVYAPTVLASFGSGGSRVDVRVIAPDGAASYTRALDADVAARKAAGIQLLRNKRIELPAHAVVELAAGWIDPRLLLMLPVLAAQHPVRILAFDDRAPGSGYGVPLSSVELSGAGRQAGMTGRGYLRWMLGFLHGQRPPYLATSITVVRHGGQQDVLVRFARPSPVGLIAHG